MIAKHPCLHFEWLVRQEPERQVVTADCWQLLPPAWVPIDKPLKHFPFALLRRSSVFGETLLATTLPNTSLLCRCKNVLLCGRHACVGTHNNYTIERRCRAAHCCFSLSHGYFSMSWMKQSRFLRVFYHLLHLQLKWACCASENCKKWKDYSPNPSVSWNTSLFLWQNTLGQSILKTAVLIMRANNFPDVCYFATYDFLKKGI